MISGAHKSEHGFTLLEMLVSLAIAGLTMAMAANLVGFVARQSGRQAVSERRLSGDVAGIALIERALTAIDRDRAVALDGQRLTLRSWTPPLSLAADGPVGLDFTVMDKGDLRSLVLKAEGDHQTIDDEGGQYPQIIIENVQEIHVDVRAGGVWLDRWADARHAPKLVRITWWRADELPHRYVFRVGVPQTPTECLRDPTARGCEDVSQ